MREALAFANAGRVLADIDPDGRPLAPTKKSGLPKKLHTNAKQIAKLQERLWAESTAGGKRRVLLLLQGIDTAGKGGVAEHVIGASGPIGVQYTAFKRPTKEELRHDFLWRIRKHVPPPGVIAIFDRSQYEDVIVPRVHDEIEADDWETSSRRDQRVRARSGRACDHGDQVLPAHLLRHPTRPADPAARAAEEALEVQRSRSRRTQALAELPGDVPGGAGTHRHRGRTVVRRAE